LKTMFFLSGSAFFVFLSCGRSSDFCLVVLKRAATNGAN
jgi:hypothetical protein